MISIRTVVNIFAFALFMGIIPTNISGKDSGSPDLNVLESQVHTEEEADLIGTDDLVSYGDYDKMSGNSLPDDAFDNIGDDEDDGDDF